MIHKETFFQAAHDGIPGHWVVQYWESKESTFPEAQYFDNSFDAAEFEKTMEYVCSPLRDTADDKYADSFRNYATSKTEEAE
jgi:hypothetical protein